MTITWILTIDRALVTEKNKTKVVETDHQKEQRLFSLVFFSVTSALSIVKIHIIVICLMMKYWNAPKIINRRIGYTD